MLSELAAIANPQITFCEKYQCIDQWEVEIPCHGKDLPIECKFICRANRQVQKSHDFELIDPILPGAQYKYLILIRNPVDAIISWWKLQVANYGQIDSRSEFESFVIKKCGFWNAFCKKWVSAGTHITESTEKNNITFVSYEELVGNKDIFCLTLKQLMPVKTHFILDKKLDDLFAEVKPHSKTWDDFEYFSADILEKCGNIVDRTMLDKIGQTLDYLPAKL